MPVKSRQARVQDVLTAIGLCLHRGAFYAQGNLLKALDPHTDGDETFTLRVVEAAVGQGVLGHQGTYYIFRRAPDHDDFVAICRREGIELPPASQALEPGVEELSRAILDLPNIKVKLQEVQQNLEMFRAIPLHHWLSLNTVRMPRDVREQLQARAHQIVGTQASQGEVEKHMVIIAAQILIHALRVPRKSTVRGIIPVDLGEPPHE